MKETNNTDNIQWLESYKIGDEYIDEEHKEFFKIAQKAKMIHKQSSLDDQRNELRAVMTEIYKYMNYHFISEEKYMQNIKYKFLDEHSQLHRKMEDQLNFINFNVSTMSIDKAEKKLFEFVQKTFLVHIINEDSKIVKFINNN